MNKVVCSRFVLVCGFHPYINFIELRQILLKSCCLTKFFDEVLGKKSIEVILHLPTLE